MWGEGLSLVLTPPPGAGWQADVAWELRRSDGTVHNFSSTPALTEDGSSLSSLPRAPSLPVGAVGLLVGRVTFSSERGTRVVGLEGKTVLVTSDGIVESDVPYTDTAISLPDQFSCQGWDDVGNTGDNGGIEWSYYSIDAFDYLGDYCNTGTMTDRGTELDWLRFFWDLDRESTGGEGMSFYTMVDLYGDALPYAWSSSDAHDDLESVYATTYSSEWGAQETLNGVHR